MTLDEAIIFAAEAHRGQRRKYTNLPYIIHPIEVMQIVSTVPHSSEMLIAAVLHDVVEDTDVTIEQIADLFGSKVARMVAGLTDPEVEGNRAVRKGAARDQLAEQDWDVQTIKVADLISNTKSIVAHDPNFAVVYLAEKRELLDILSKANGTLWVKAAALAGVI